MAARMASTPKVLLTGSSVTSRVAARALAGLGDA